MSDAMTVLKYDICIIGAGSAGLSVAAAASMLGLKVALIEKKQMGGDCLNTGCVPSKALLAAAKKAEEINSAPAFGVDAGKARIDYKQVQAHVADVIRQIAPMDSVERYEGMGADIYGAAAYFESAKKVILEGLNIAIEAKKFVIAVGGRPFVPPIDGLEKNGFYTNETIFQAPKKPDQLLIIGGGPIGIEMAQAHQRLGSQVTLISDQTILPSDDPELVEVVRRKLISEGVQLIEGARLSNIDGGFVHFEKDGAEAHAKFSDILVATGRRPNLVNLGLKKAGIDYNEHGITVNDRLQTSQSHIYAMGDCARHPEKGQPQFTHMASYHAGVIVKNILFKLPSKIDYSNVPHVTYCDPELGWTGMSEAGAREKHGDKIQILRWPYMENDRARAERRLDGATKLIAYKGKIIGGGIVGPHAGEQLPLISLAVQKKLSISDLSGLIVPYPTTVEVVKRAAGDYLKNKLFSDLVKKIVRFLARF